MRSLSSPSITRALLILSIALGATATSPARATAQASERELSQARGLFREGVAAGHDGRWSDALDDFVRAHALSGRAEVLLNVAAAQVEVELFADARATYLRFRAEATTEMLEAHGAGVSEALAAIDERAPSPSVAVDLSTEEGPRERALSISLSDPPPVRHDDSTLWIVLGVVGSVLFTSGAVAVGVVASGI